MQQLFENLPAEIKNSRRFFLVGADKRPLTKDWSNPAVQKSFSEINGVAGFDTCGHGVVTDDGRVEIDYALLDFDHCLNDAGEFITPAAADFFEAMKLTFDNLYTEKSISGTGLHVLLIPTAGKFDTITNSKDGVLYFDSKYEKDSPKLEVFYNSRGRYVLLTGDLYDCDSNAQIPAGVEVDKLLTETLAEIQKQLQGRGVIKDSGSEQNIFADEVKEKTQPARRAEYDDPPEYTHDLAAALLEAINPAVLTDTDWLAVISACKNIGVDYAIVDKWNAGDSARYDEAENKVRWDSLSDSSYGIEVLIGKASSFNIGDFKRNWYQQHPQFSKAQSQKTPPEFDADNPLDWLGDTKAQFEELLKSPPSKNRNAAMIQIIKRKLEWEKVRGRWRVDPSVANLRKIFSADPALKDLFARESFNGETVLTQQPFWAKEARVNSQWKNDDDAELRAYLRENYSQQFTNGDIDDVFISTANAGEFNVVRDWFNKLPKWDGTPRADSVFIKFLRVEDTPYARAVTLNWLTAAVARIFFPGCSYQTALVLQGQQHIGKSHILKQLGGGWYGALSSNVDNPNVLYEIRRFWLAEIKEMSAMRKIDVNAQKDFLERAVDTYRAAYARRAEEYKRHCVFAITVNDAEFLRDVTGNRRFLILKCNSAKFEIVQGLTDEYIRQVWAEVYQQFKEATSGGFHDSLLELPLDFKLQAETIATGFTVDDGLAGEISAFLDIEIPQLVWEYLTKEEKRRYFEHNSITLEADDLYQRVESKYIGYGERLKSTVTAYAEAKQGVIINTGARGVSKGIYGVATTFTFYGDSLRKETCAAEIHNEFGKDRRLTTRRIGEVLSQLDGWKLTDKQRKNFSGCYGNQKKIYRRGND